MTEDQNKEVCISKLVGQKEFTITLEEDFVVPDIKPDIISCISTSGLVYVYKKEVLDGKVKLDGTVSSYIIYLSETENNAIRSMNVNLDFSEVIDFDGLTKDMIVEENVCIKEIECRVLNGRKISITVTLTISLKVCSNENVCFLNTINDIDDIKTLKENISLNSLLGRGTTKVYAKDTITLNDSDEIAEIMKVCIDIKNKESKISYNKILIKADACVKIIYLNMDNKICKKSAVIPIMGFIDIKDITDDTVNDLNYEIRNILIKPQSGEENKIYIEIEVEINCSTYIKKDIEVLQDIYSPSVNLKYNKNKIRTVANKSCIKDVCNVRNKQEVSIENINVKQIYDVDINPYILNYNIASGVIEFSGEIALNILFISNDYSMESSKIVLPFDYQMNNLGIDDDAKIDYLVDVISQDFTIMVDGSIDMKIDLEFTVSSFKYKNINVINNVEKDFENEIKRPKYSMVIYLVKPGDTIWKIAKKFRSSVDSIINLNNVENEDDLIVGQQLFIPMTI